MIYLYPTINRRLTSIFSLFVSFTSGTLDLDHGLHQFHSYSALKYIMFMKILKHHIGMLTKINGLKSARKSQIIIAGVFGLR